MPGGIQPDERGGNPRGAVPGLKESVLLNRDELLALRILGAGCSVESVWPKAGIQALE